MQNYKELRVWQRAHQLVLGIYRASKSFPKEEVYALTSQIRRSASSTPTNIVEGCGKFTAADFANFLQIALGSANETEYLLLLAKDLEYLTIEHYAILDRQVNEVKTMLIDLINKVRNTGKFDTYNL